MCFIGKYLPYNATNAVIMDDDVPNNKLKVRRRVSSVVKHSSANPKVPGSIPGLVSYWGNGL